MAFQHIKGAHKKDRERGSIKVCNDTSRRKGFKTEEGTGQKEGVFAIGVKDRTGFPEMLWMPHHWKFSSSSQMGI